MYTPFNRRLAIKEISGYELTRYINKFSDLYRTDFIE